ncbi:hypothetical protein GBAR_LOCUS1716, partial [Geodia barretti]
TPNRSAPNLCSSAAARSLYTLHTRGDQSDRLLQARRAMSLVVTVAYEPDGSPSLRDRRLEMKVSRLQTSLDIARDVYEKVKGELQKPFEDYILYWPRQKVGVVLHAWNSRVYADPVHSKLHVPVHT